MAWNLAPQCLPATAMRECRFEGAMCTIQSRSSPNEVIQVVDKPRMLQQGALGSTSGAAGEDDVGQTIGMAAPLSRPLLGIDGHLVPVCIQVHPLRSWRQGNDSIYPGEAQQYRHLSKVVLLLEKVCWAVPPSVAWLIDSSCFCRVQVAGSKLWLD